MRVTSVLAIAAVSILFSACVDASRLREMALPEKVEESDAILVIEVIRNVENASGDSDVDAHSEFMVSERVKWDGSSLSLRLVTYGPIPVMNPHCCLAGGKYLVFLRYGYRIFGILDGEIGIVTEGEADYVSVVNGRYGTYKIDDGQVIGWSDEPLALDSVVKEIRRIE